MSKQFIRAFAVRGAAEGQPGDPIRFIASTEGIKRDGIDLRADDWWLDNFRKNPVFLWAHDYWGQKLPLGRVEPYVEDGKLMADVWFDQEDEFAQSVESKYRRGFLHTVSVGWNFIEMDQRRVMDLLDLSGVPVPGDPDALVVRQYQALKDIVENAEDGEEPGEGAWREIAAEMVAVFHPAPDDTDESRERRYKALLPKYRRLGKVAPEFRSGEDLTALGAEEVEGLFLEDEPALVKRERAGVALSTRNRDDLEQAIALMQSVLDRAGEAQEEAPRSEEDEPEEPEDEDPNPRREEIARNLRAIKIKTQLLEIK